MFWPFCVAVYIYIANNYKAMTSQVMWVNIVLCFIYVKLYYT